MTGPAVHVAALLLACGLCIVSAGISPTTPARSGAKVGMLYAGIGVEMISHIVLSTFDYHPAVELSERYGALTLIIM